MILLVSFIARAPKIRASKRSVAPQDALTLFWDMHKLAPAAAAGLHSSRPVSKDHMGCSML